MYKKRFYRTKTYNVDLVTFNVRYFESNLQVYAQTDLREIALEYLRNIHTQVSVYCKNHPEFEKSLSPVKIKRKAPEIIKRMHKAAKQADVGPMATVAGAIAQAVGEKLLIHSREVIIENGGDIFIAVAKPRIIGIFAGIGNVYNQLVINIDPEQTPCGICTSSGKFGHSLSLGQSCATIIISKSSTLADGYATHFGNIVNTPLDIDFALKSARRKKDIKGIIIITNTKMAAYGNFTFDIHF